VTSEELKQKIFLLAQSLRWFKGFTPPEAFAAAVSQASLIYPLEMLAADFDLVVLESEAYNKDNFRGIDIESDIYTESDNFTREWVGDARGYKNWKRMSGISAELRDLAKTLQFTSLYSAQAQPASPWGSLHRYGAAQHTISGRITRHRPALQNIPLRWAHEQAHPPLQAVTLKPRQRLGPLRDVAEEGGTGPTGPRQPGPRDCGDSLRSGVLTRLGATLHQAVEAAGSESAAAHGGSGADSGAAGRGVRLVGVEQSPSREPGDDLHDK
jgi:hypothetical protein